MPPLPSSLCRLAARIHEGLVWSNRDRRTLLDKMISLIGITDVDQPFYFVADAYDGAQKIIVGLLKQNNHLVTRVNRMPSRTLLTNIADRASEARPGNTARSSR